MLLVVTFTMVHGRCHFSGDWIKSPCELCDQHQFTVPCRRLTQNAPNHRKEIASDKVGRGHRSTGIEHGVRFVDDDVDSPLFLDDTLPKVFIERKFEHGRTVPFGSE
jgi:hypothetical protein